MAEFKGFMHGMGIGGWLTNYKRLFVLPEEWKRPITIGDWEHFQTYITRRDVDYIASLGMDHIRLAFDQIVLENFYNPGTYYDLTWKLLDQFVEWCESANVNVVLNMHKAIGNDYAFEEKVALLDDEGLQKRFVDVWVEIERHFQAKPDIAFELLNEVRDIDPQLWNNLAERTINEIRKLNPTRKIIIGSTRWNHPDRIPDLKLFDDPNIIYTWHFYTPPEFTHQRSVLVADQLYYNRVLPYPALTEEDMERYRGYRRLFHGKDDMYENVTKIDRDYLRNVMMKALEFSKLHPDKIFWLGEFGSIRHIKIEHRENYMRDIISICKEFGIAYCVWNYLSTPNDGNRFSLVDDDRREILSPELARIIRGDV